MDLKAAYEKGNAQGRARYRARRDAKLGYVESYAVDAGEHEPICEACACWSVDDSRTTRFRHLESSIAHTCGRAGSV